MMRDVRTLPTAELHLHIEGTLEPELAFELAERNGVELPYSDVEDLRRHYRFGSLQEFLDLYYACTSVLRTEQDFHDLTAAYLRRAIADGVRHVEVFFDPEAHLDRGVPLEYVVGGIRSALHEAHDRDGVTSGIIMCVLRHLPAERSLDTLRRMADAYGGVIAREAVDGDWVGIGLDSGERGNPPEKHRDVFARAAKLGLHRVAHAGEEGGPESIRGALDALGAERIDHGVHAVDDPALLAELAARQVPLTVCPLSNVALKVVDDIREHPLPKLLAADARVTINSDDPAYFGGYLGDNLAAVRRAFDLDDAVIAQLARNSVQGSFASPERKAQLLAQIDAWAQGA